MRAWKWPDLQQTGYDPQHRQVYRVVDIKPKPTTTYAGQLAAYRDVLQAASGLPVEEMWLILPVAGAALQVEVG